MFDLMPFPDPRPRADAARPPRIVLYSHDTLGFGHLRRNLLIAGALGASDPAPEILLVGGMREAGAFEMPAGVDCITLPAYAKGADGSYRPRDLGGELGALTALRSEVICATVTAFNPDLVIVDNVPRGALFELDATLHVLRRRGRARLILGLRDVIDRPSVVRRQWLKQRNFETVRTFYDAIWIYGDPTLYDLVTECGLAGPFAGRSTYVGYLDHGVRRTSSLAVVDRDAVLRGDTSPYVLCTVGGGRDGAALCEAFVRARLPDGHRGILVTGTQMPTELRARVRDLARERSDMTVVPFVREPIALMEGAARIVAMGGYNTVCEILSLGQPALIVPRASPRAEQLIRAERLEARGLMSMLHPQDLTPAALSAWLASPARGARSVPLDMGGLGRVAELVHHLLLAPTPARAS